jgi:hypothetical protein
MAVTFSPNPTTELEAVNLMLMSIGKAPVNSLSVPGINDVSFATLTLYNTVRDVQSRGWWFNRETNYPITPDVNGFINIPATVLDFWPSERFRGYVERNGQLYDPENSTFNIGQNLNGNPLLCDVIWCFPYQQLPQAARTYIGRRAGREFQTNSVGSQVLYQFTKESELEAFADLQRRENLAGGSNMFAAPTRNSRIFNRQPGAYRRSW